MSGFASSQTNKQMKMIKSYTTRRALKCGLVDKDKLGRTSWGRFPQLLTSGGRRVGAGWQSGVLSCRCASVCLYVCARACSVLLSATPALTAPPTAHMHTHARTCSESDHEQISLTAAAAAAGISAAGIPAAFAVRSFAPHACSCSAMHLPTLRMRMRSCTHMAVVAGEE